MTQRALLKHQSMEMSWVHLKAMHWELEMEMQKAKNLVYLSVKPMAKPMDLGMVVM